MRVNCSTGAVIRVLEQPEVHIFI